MEANKAAFEEVFARHKNPAEICSDNGPPFNGKDDHILQEYYRQEGIYHRHNQSPYDPEANDLAESFMKHMKPRETLLVTKAPENGASHS